MKISVDDSEEQDVTLEFEMLETTIWFTVKLGEGRPDASVLFKRTDEGLVVDVFQLDGEMDEPLGSTYVFDHELTRELLP